MGLLCGRARAGRRREAIRSRTRRPPTRRAPSTSARTTPDTGPISNSASATMETSISFHFSCDWPRNASGNPTSTTFIITSTTMTFRFPPAKCQQMLFPSPPSPTPPLSLCLFNERNREREREDGNNWIKFLVQRCWTLIRITSHRRVAKIGIAVERIPDVTLNRLQFRSVERNYRT